MQTQEAFTATRLTGIGGSDAATVCGLNPWKSAYELWQEKTGQITPDDISDREHIIWGNKLEPVIAERYEEVTGRIVRVNENTLRHPDYDFMIAHLDRETDDPDRILECKTTNAYGASNWGPSGTDNVPEHYLLQCQHYMAVTSKEFCDLAVLIGGSDFRIYELRRDDELIDLLISKETEFWQMVQDGTPPAIDTDAPGAVDLLKRIYPGTNGIPIELSLDAMAWHLEMQAAKSCAAKHQQDVETLKAKLLAEMGNSPMGLFPDGSGYTRKEITRGAYEVKATTYTDFRFKKAAK